MVKIAGEIPFSELAEERAGAIAHLGRNLKIDGFRPGHVPEAMLVQRLGEGVTCDRRLPLRQRSKLVIWYKLPPATIKVLLAVSKM